MRSLLIFTTSIGLSIHLLACGGSDRETNTESLGGELRSEERSQPGAREGELCGDGAFGAPNVACTSGLICKYEFGTEPAGAPAAGSGRTGRCKRLGADFGELCAHGAFGIPNIPCGPGLICSFPDGGAPVGPSESASAVTGTCIMED